ncbi:hypothetical protein [Bacillus cereus]|uniref:hypothetical protein n=1 Tax=Bacillus cereus TaxID=1396 RepID=UPI0039815E7B
MKSLNIQINNDDIVFLKKLGEYVKGSVFEPPGLTVKVHDPVQEKPMTYPARNRGNWTVHKPVNDEAGNELKGLKLWMLPDYLADSAAVRRPYKKAIRLIQETYNTKSRRSDCEVVDNAVWATRLKVRVKKLPSIESTYELFGVQEQDMTLLQRLRELTVSDLERLGTYVHLLFPDENGGEVHSAMEEAVLFLTQSDINPESHPGGQLVHRKVENNGLYGSTSEFIRMLWEGSVTRQGGYTLGYYRLKEKDGLPGHLFKGKDETVIELLFLFPKADNTIRSYVNCVVTGDLNNSVVEALPLEASEPSRTVSLYVEEIPGTYQYKTSVQTLAQIAEECDTDVVRIAEFNLERPLAPGRPMYINNGLYKVRLDGPRKLQEIVGYFHTTADELRKENPDIDDWENLSYSTVVRLPRIQIQTGANQYLLAIAQFYGISVAMLATDNQHISGIYESGIELTVPIGRMVRTALLPPGVVELRVERQEPEDENESEEQKPEKYVPNLFQLLHYKVWENHDFFKSKLGRSLSPTDEKQQWVYAKAVPYANFSKKMMREKNPYRGIGSVLQLDLHWKDPFGNQICSSFDAMEDGGNGNRVPALMGYTDQLIGLGQWPLTASYFEILSGISGRSAKLKMTFTFDECPFQRECDNQKRREKAAEYLYVYQQIHHQLQHTLSGQFAVSFYWKTSLMAERKTPLSKKNANRIRNRVEEICGFLNKVKEGEKPDWECGVMELVEEIPLNSINPRQIFELETQLIFERPYTHVSGPFRTMDSVWKSVTSILPFQDKEGVRNQNTMSLRKFAHNLEKALKVNDKVIYKTATGQDRTQLTQGVNGRSIWLVRMGKEHNHQEGIDYAINGQSEPILYAPQPVTNIMQPFSYIKSWNYKVELDRIVFDEDLGRIDDTTINMEKWAREFLQAFDRILLPEYTTPLTILAEQEEGDNNYLNTLLDLKSKLADVISLLVYPMYRDELRAESTALAAAREAYCQRLLKSLSNAYYANAIIQFKAVVQADHVPDSETKQPDRLYGPIVANPGVELPKTISLSTPKLNLRPTTGAANELLTFVMSGQSPEQDLEDPAQNSICPYVKLEADYFPTHIEHQIETLPELGKYVASSWLYFVLPPRLDNSSRQSEEWPLRKKLGSFKVPLVLRDFPEVPEMVRQYYEDPLKVSSNMAVKSLADYLMYKCFFSYRRKRHAPQDRTYVTVTFNVKFNREWNDNVINLCTELAQFQRLYNESVKGRLEKHVKTIKVGTVLNVEEMKLASNVVQDFIEMGTRIERKWKEWMEGVSVPRLRAEGEKYMFFIKEASGAGQELIVRLEEMVLPPYWSGKPFVYIKGYKTIIVREGYVNQRRFFEYQFVKKGTTNEYLLAIEGMNIAERRVEFTNKNILMYQDVSVAVHVTRNEVLVDGYPMADSFVYRTGENRFKNPLIPYLIRTDPIDIARLEERHPELKSLETHLSHFFKVLFNGVQNNSVQTFQLEWSYSFKLPSEIERIKIPHFMMPKNDINIENSFDISGDWTMGQLDRDFTFISNLASSIWKFFSLQVPNGHSGRLHFHVKVLSNLTQQCYPLLEFTNVYLDLEHITPQPPYYRG